LEGVLALKWKTTGFERSKRAMRARARPVLVSMTGDVSKNRAYRVSTGDCSRPGVLGSS
jgi:hypothetical protein